MSTPNVTPNPDTSNVDPAVLARIQALIAAHQAEQTAATPPPTPAGNLNMPPAPAPVTPPTPALQPGAPTPTPNTTPAATTLAAANPQSASQLLGSMGPQPAAPAATPATPPPGPVKQGLHDFLYGFGQAALKHVGLQTDAEKAQQAANISVAQQNADANTGYRNAITDLTMGKGKQLDDQNAPFTFGNTPDIPAQFRGQTMPTVAAQALQKIFAQNAGKENVAQINIGAGTVPLSPKLATIAGLPAGTPVSGKFLTSLVKENAANGANIIQGDIGNGHTGLINKGTGEVLQDFGTSQRIIGSAMNANNRTVQVVNPNDPNSTIMMSPAQANATGAQGTQSIGYQTNKALNKYFTSGAGGSNLTAFNTAINHLSLLKSATGALNNGDVQVFNKIGNQYATQTGSPAPTNFAAVKTAVAGEVAKVFKGVATEGEIKSINDEINSSESPQQLYGVINTYTGLMSSKRDALHDQYVQGQQGKPNFGTPSAPASATSVTAPNGKTYNFPDAASAAAFKAKAGIK